MKERFSTESKNSNLKSDGAFVSLKCVDFKFTNSKKNIKNENEEIKSSKSQGDEIIKNHMLLTKLKDALLCNPLKEMEIINTVILCNSLVFELLFPFANNY